MFLRRVPIAVFCIASLALLLLGCNGSTSDSERTPFRPTPTATPTETLVPMKPGESVLGDIKPTPTPTASASPTAVIQPTAVAFSWTHKYSYQLDPGYPGYADPNRAYASITLDASGPAGGKLAATVSTSGVMEPNTQTAVISGDGSAKITWKVWKSGDFSICANVTFGGRTQAACDTITIKAP